VRRCARLVVTWHSVARRDMVNVQVTCMAQSSWVRRHWRSTPHTPAHSTRTRIGLRSALRLALRRLGHLCSYVIGLAYDRLGKRARARKHYKKAVRCSSGAQLSMLSLTMPTTDSAGPHDGVLARCCLHRHKQFRCADSPSLALPTANTELVQQGLRT